MDGTRLLLIGLLFSAVALPTAAQGRSECSAGALLDSLRPSREGFFREVLFAAGSARTPRFDDYTPGSYHVDKLDLADGLPPVAEKCGLALEALVVVGPVGPLWTYHVIVFLREDPGLRLNTLVMPHARITGKATGHILRDRFTDFLDQLPSSPVLTTGRPTWSDTATTRLARDFSYDFLAVRFGAAQSSSWYGSIGRDPESRAARELLRALNTLLEGTQPTYSHSN